MHSGADYDRFLLLLFLGRIAEVRYGEHVARIARQRLAQRLPLKLILAPWILLDLVQVPHQVRVRVRVAVRQVHSIVVVVEIEAESQGVVMEGTFSLHGVGIITDILATTNPSSIVSLGVDLRVQQWLHAMIV